MNKIKERVELYGAQSLFNKEALSLLLGIKQNLLEGIETISELKEIKDSLKLTVLQSQKLEVFFELTGRVLKEQTQKISFGAMTSPLAVYNSVKHEMIPLQKEEFRIILLNSKYKKVDIKTISVGSLNASIVHPREVFREAILAAACAIILVHNHPSGDPSPSKEDSFITKRLCDAGDLLGIAVLDHIIVGSNDYYSFKEKKQM